MKKPIILSVLFFIITAISSFGQGVWIVENVDPETGLRTGLIGNPAGDIYRIKPNAILIEADLRGADLSKTNLEGANLSQANLSQANLSRANLEGVNLEGANLERANLEGANLEGANLREANLRSSILELARINKTDLRGSSLIYAKFSHSGTGLSSANLGGTNVRSIRLGSLPIEDGLGELLSGLTRGNYNTITKVEADVNSLAARASDYETNIETNKSEVDAISEQMATLKASDTTNTTIITRNTSEIAELKPIVEALSNNDTAIGEQIIKLGQNDTAIGEQIIKLGQNDESIIAEINAMKAQLQTLVASVAEKDAKIVELEKRPTVEQLATVEAEKDAISQDIVALYEDFRNTRDELDELKKDKNALDENVATLVSQRDEAIAERDERPTPEQIRDARAGSVVLTVDPEGDNITLGLTIEQSDNLIEWTKLDGEMTRTIPIPDGKKFYRFALDK